MREALFQQATKRGVPLDPHAPEPLRIIRAVKAIPYGRARDRSARALLDEWRGTCSGKHYLLRELLSELDIPVRLTHRVYRLTRDDVTRLFPWAAHAVPNEGLIDVHTFAQVLLAGRWTQIDVTFPGPWDGSSDLPLACGPGTDVEVGPDDDPDAVKRRLVSHHCDPGRREPFIAALSRVP